MFARPRRTGFRILPTARRSRFAGSYAPVGGADRSWAQVTGNEGYRVIWGSSSQAGASASIDEIQALYANVTDTPTNVNSYAIAGTGTIYWRVAVLINGNPQEWSDESSFSA